MLSLWRKSGNSESYFPPCSRQCWDLFLNMCGISWEIPQTIKVSWLSESPKEYPKSWSRFGGPFHCAHFGLYGWKGTKLASKGIEITSQELRIDVLIIYIIGVNAVLLDLHKFYGFPRLVRRKVTYYTFWWVNINHKKDNLQNQIQ